MRDVRIVGTGRYLPSRVVSNTEIVEQLKEAGAPEDTNEQWIVERTGVRERRVAAPDENTSDMALQAALNCLEKAGVIDYNQVDLIVVPTVSGDTNFPATANWLQGKLGNYQAWALDLNAGCSGFIYGLATVTALVRSGMSKLALLVGAEKMSALYDPSDRSSYPLAGDGAAAVLLWGTDQANGHGIQEFYLKSDGEMADVLIQPLGGTRYPLTPNNVTSPDRYLQMQGRIVYKHAIRRMIESIKGVLAKAYPGVPMDEAIDKVDWFVGHQANDRILHAVASGLGISLEKMYSNISRYANTTSATIPLCLDELAESGQLRPGHKVVLFTFGTGFTWGSCYLIWGR